MEDITKEVNQPQIDEPKKKKTWWKWLLFLIFLIGIVFSIFYFFVRVYHVDPGYIGVKSSINNPADNSAAYETTMVNGYVVYIPLMTNLKIYPTSEFSYQLSQLTAYSKDGIGLKFAPKVSLQLESSKADKYYLSFKDISLENNDHIEDNIKNVLANATSSFDTDSLIKNKSNFEAQLQTTLQAKLSEYGLLVKNINSNLDYPEDVKNRVELKLKLEQDILVAQTQAKLAYIEAETKRKKDSLEYSVLSNLSIQKLFIDKWDGRLAPNPEQPKAYRDINSDSPTSDSTTFK